MAHADDASSASESRWSSSAPRMFARSMRAPSRYSPRSVSPFTASGPGHPRRARRRGRLSDHRRQAAPGSWCRRRWPACRRSSSSAAARPSTTCRWTATHLHLVGRLWRVPARVRRLRPLVVQAGPGRLRQGRPGHAQRVGTSAVVSAQDCPTETRMLHEFDACMRNSEKHHIVVSMKEDWGGAQPHPHGRGHRRRQQGAGRQACL